MPMMNTDPQPAVARDPVCWMDIDADTASFTYQHEGNTYVFCSQGCMTDFTQRPAHYLGPTYQPQSMDDLPP
jgi:Cu+-exporting ATPase